MDDALSRLYTAAYRSELSAATEELDRAKAQVQKGVEGIKSVEKAGDADTLGGKTADQLTQDILEKVRQEIPKRTGYRLLFKRLKFDDVKKVGEEKVIEHGLDACPLVDVYQLEPPTIVIRHERM